MPDSCWTFLVSFTVFFLSIGRPLGGSLGIFASKAFVAILICGVYQPLNLLPKLLGLVAKNPIHSFESAPMEADPSVEDLDNQVPVFMLV